MKNPEEKAYIFGSIFTLSNRLQILGDKFDENITIKQWLLLAAIFKNSSPSPTISEVADIIGNSRQNVKKMSLILEKDGFLEMNKDKNDKRIIRIRLTQKCLDYFKGREKRENEFIEQLFQDFDVKEIHSMKMTMMKLAKNISKMESIINE